MNFKAVLITVWIWFPALETAYGTENQTFLVCDSPECIDRAKLLNESLNTSIDPCTDFYSYVCDRWESNHPLTNGRKSYDVYDEIRKDIPEMLSYILGNRTWVESNQTIIDKVATMYNACLALPDTPDVLIRVLNESGYNSWPILSGQNIFNCSNCTDLLHHMDISAILHVEIGHKRLYARKPVYDYTVYIKPMPVQEEIMKLPDIKAVINNTIKLLHPGINSLILENLTNQLVDFANNMSEVTKETNLHDTYSISSLEATFPNIPISVLLKKEFEKVNITLTDTEKVAVYKIYCENLNNFLGTADPNTLYNYAGFLALFPYLEYVQMSTESNLTMSTTKRRNRSECITLLDKSARDVLDYLYITNQPNHTSIKNEVDDIARRLIEAFNKTLQNNSWIDNTTRQAFEKQLKEVPLGIGYPDALMNLSVLEVFYKYVPYFPSNISFTEAFYYFQENLYKMELRKFRHPEESNWRWVHSPREGRRKFHEKFGMDVEIPYPIFVSPVFQRGLPRSFNYGGIGGTIARELAYSFSLNGIQIIKRNYRSLVTDKFLKLFNDKASCFKQQYMEANKEMLRGSSEKPPYFWPQTSDQDFADNAGLQTAFQAYSKVLDQECYGQDTQLAGLGNFSGMQLFFISNARTMCKIADNDALVADIGIGHSPAPNRVNEVMKNFEEFAKAFNCSLGSPMHPNKTCSWW